MTPSLTGMCFMSMSYAIKANMKRTGRVWHGLGNVRYDQGDFQESEALHKKSLAHYQHIIGNTNHKTADLMYRVAHHCLRRQDYSVARYAQMVAASSNSG